MKEKIRSFFSSRRAQNGGSTAALVALVLALFYLCNTVLLAVADRYALYFYTGAQLDITVSGAADELLGTLRTEGKKITVLFCDSEENIEKHSQLDLVYDTAVAMQERYPDLLELSYVNLWLEPARVAPYRENEDGTENKISTSTVIFDCEGEFMLNSPVSFYTLDENNYVTSFNGEEVFVANMLWVGMKEHPVAYFTANHGEEIPSALHRALTYAGYRVERLDLSTVRGVPADAGMIVISAPHYNFGKAAAGSSEKAELDFLADYLAGGGQVLAMLDAGYAENMRLPNGNPPHLLSFLAEYGITVQPGRLIDRQNALPGSGGYSLITSYASGEAAADLAARAETADRRIILSDAAVLTLQESALAHAVPLLQAPSSATRIDAAGQTLGGAGTVLAMAEMKEGGGRLVVAGSAYLADVGLVDGPGYGNKGLIQALLTELGATRVVTGIENLQIDTSAIEDLTMGEADLFFALSAIFVPLLILLAGAIILRRRKNH